MTPTELTDWRKSYGLNRSAAARYLGISRRALFNYEQGVRPVPRPIELACRANKEESQ